MYTNMVESMSSSFAFDFLCLLPFERRRREEEGERLNDWLRTIEESGLMDE
jgi:hypothetical protein